MCKNGQLYNHGFGCISDKAKYFCCIFLSSSSSLSSCSILVKSWISLRKVRKAPTRPSMNIFTCVVFLIINYLIIAIIGLLNYLLSISNPKSMSLTSQTSVFNSWVNIIFEKENSKFVASKQKNLFSESTTFCYYFPQIEEVVYLELSK